MILLSDSVKTLHINKTMAIMLSSITNQTKNFMWAENILLGIRPPSTLHTASHIVAT